MTHRIKSVTPLENRIVSVVFQNGITKTYDMKLLYPVFSQFQDFEVIDGLFEQVKVDVGGYGISWNDDLDLDAEDIWEEGTLIESVEPEIMDLLADELMKARSAVGITQKQLAEKTGIYQSDISKIERGLANPSLQTLKRLAEGMDLTLKIEFVDKI